VRNCRVGLIAALILLAACGAVDGPRQSTATAPSVTQQFDSPRSTYVVEPDPDIGAVTFRGIVLGRDPVEVAAPANGLVSDVLIPRGHTVSPGTEVLEFLPSPSAAEQLALQIAELTIEQVRVDGGSAADILAAERDRDAVADSIVPELETIRAPTSGVLLGGRQNLQYEVEQGDVLFTIVDPADVVVELRLSSTEPDAVAVGTTVVMSTSDADEDALTGTVIDVSPQDRTVTVELDQPGQVMLSDRVSASLAVQSSEDTSWVPEQAIGRQSGSSYVLIQNDRGQLVRRQVQIGQRTLTHAEVLSDLPAGTVLVAP